MNSHSEVSFIPLIFRLHYECIGYKESPLLWIKISHPLLLYWASFYRIPVVLFSEDEKEEVEMDEYPQDPVTRAQALTTKVRRRMYKRAIREFKGIQMRSQENLQKLNFTVDLVSFTRNSFKWAWICSS